MLLRFLLLGGTQTFMEELKTYSWQKQEHIVFLPSKKNKHLIRICAHNKIPFYLVQTTPEKKHLAIFTYFQLMSWSNFLKKQHYF